MSGRGLALKLRLPLFALSSTAAVVARRLRRGPLRPGWSWSMELFAGLMRSAGSAVYGLPLEEQGPFWDSLALPSPVLKRVRFEAVDAGGVRAEWIVPPEPGARVILYLHGGWYSTGYLQSYRELLARIALASGARVLAVDYRLAPAHPYPAAIDDTLAAWRWLAARHSPAQLIVAGDSAGGGLALALLQRLRDAREPLPCAALLLCPWVDLSATGGSLLAHAPFDWGTPEEVERRIALYLGDGDRRRPEVSAVFADLRGLPPMLIQAGGAEMLFDQEAALAARAREAGVEVTFDVAHDMLHDWQLFASLLPEGRAAIERIGAYVKKQA